MDKTLTIKNEREFHKIGILAEHEDLNNPSKESKDKK